MRRVTVLIGLFIVGLVLPVSSPVIAQTGEIIALRTETSKTYGLGGGMYRMISSGPLHYQDSFGNWQDIDNAIVDDRMLQDSYNLRILQRTFDQGQIVEWSVGEDYVRFQPMELGWTNDLSQVQQISMPQAVSGVVSNVAQNRTPDDPASYIQGKIVWEDVYGAGRDFQWVCSPHVLEKILTLGAAPPVPAAYIISGGNPALKLSFIFAPSSGVDIYVDGVLWDKKSDRATFNAIEFRKNGEVRWVFCPAVYWDSGGRSGYGKTTLRKSGQSLYVETYVPYSWLQTAVYPAYVDPTVSIYSSSADGYISSGNSNYNTARTSATGAVTDSATAMVIGQELSGGTYYVRRSYVFFDTSTIPAAAIIDSGTVYLYGNADASLTDFAITICRDSDNVYPQSPLQTGNFDMTLYDENNGSLSTASFTTSGYNQISLTTSWVQKGGTTRLAIRSSRDIGGNTPTGAEYVSVKTAEETGTSQDPYVSVVYIIPPEVDTLACDDITYNSFTANGEITEDYGITVTRRGFGYTTIYDDFEWGNDGDPLTDDGGVIDWSTSGAGSSSAEIDTAQKHGGTRSALLYRDGTNSVSAYFSQSPLTTDQVLDFWLREDGSDSQFLLAHGDGTNRIVFRYYYSTRELQYYNGAAYVGTGVYITREQWTHVCVEDVDFTGGTYDLRQDGVLAKDDAPMYASSSSNGIIQLQNGTVGTAGGKSLWVDDLYVWDIEDELGSFGEGEYDLEITGLSASTTYRVQSFADNSAGIGYGDVVEQTTPAYLLAISNNPDNNAFGTLAVSTSSGTAIDYFTITNTGTCIVDVVIYGTDATSSVSGIQEYYNTGDDEAVYLTYGSFWRAQTFTPAETHTVTSVKLKLYRAGSPGTITVGIRATDGSSHPTGTDLCYGTTNGDTLTTDSGGEWREVTLGDGCGVTAETKYAIVVRAPSGDVTNSVRWRDDGSSPTYAGGCVETSSDGGSSWSSTASRDFMFEEYASDVITWDLDDTGTPGEDIYALTAGLDDDDDLFDVIVRESATYNTLLSGLMPDDTQDWGLKIWMPTAVVGYTGQEMEATITLVASESS